MPLFSKAAYFTDIHFGRNGNHPSDNLDNVEFVDWFIAEAQARGCDTFIFGGDFFDNRHNLHLSTLHAALGCLRKLNQAFAHSYFILGNHDLFFRHSREITSLEVAGDLDQITIIREPQTYDGVTFLPWLLHDEHKMLKADSRYVFAHLGVAGFLMNSKVAAKDGPETIDAQAFPDNEYVFTGHFHMRQQKGNIVYTGNVMPFDFADNWDEARGAMFLEWGGAPEYLAWPDQPVFRTTKVSDLLTDPAAVLRRKATIRAVMDEPLTYEESQEIKEALVQQYGLRKLELIPADKSAPVDNLAKTVKFHTVDQIVIEGLMSMQSGDVRPETLVAIYQALPSEKN